MGAPHNIKRYGEVWPEFRIQSGLGILDKLKDKVIISGVGHGILCQKQDIQNTSMPMTTRILMFCKKKM